MASLTRSKSNGRGLGAIYQVFVYTLLVLLGGAISAAAAMDAHFVA